MDSQILVLAGAAASIGVIHTALGPDHYIPFIALSKSQNWSKLKTILVTSLSGLGHVGSSILIGVFGYLIGTSLFSLEALESIRGNVAGWSLIILGLLYTVWGIKKSFKKESHSHIHIHTDGTAHTHSHNHENSTHAHIHKSGKSDVTPWMIFLIFLFGPCEPLIPLLIYPAAEQNTFAVVLISLVFSISTIMTMLVIVFFGLYGLSFLPIAKINKHIHTLSGFSILICGVGIQFLGL
ncbi:MAG: sulfite exporter TauE/SafE family protein [Bacteroidota bacterium]